MPSKMVIRIPPGSRPGMMSLATAPTIRPTMSVASKCMTDSWFRDGGEFESATGDAVGEAAHAIDHRAALGHELLERDPRGLGPALRRSLGSSRVLGSALDVCFGLARRRL